MKKLTLFLIPLLLLGIGCNNSVAPNFPEEYAPGQVLVKFDKSTPKTEAKDFIEHLSLELIDLSVIDTDNYYWILVGVPEGEEKTWVKKFLTYSFVEHAELNGIVHAAE